MPFCKGRNHTQANEKVHRQSIRTSSTCSLVNTLQRNLPLLRKYLELHHLQESLTRCLQRICCCCNLISKDFWVCSVVLHHDAGIQLLWTENWHDFFTPVLFLQVIRSVRRIFLIPLHFPIEGFFQTWWDTEEMFDFFTYINWLHLYQKYGTSFTVKCNI